MKRFNQYKLFCESQENGLIKVTGTIHIVGEPMKWSVEVLPDEANDVDRQYLLDDAKEAILNEIEQLKNDTAAVYNAMKFG
jgi:hypothetical protein